MSRWMTYGLMFFAILEVRSQQTRLSYDLDTGEVYLLELDITQDTRSESAISDEISLYSRMEMEFSIDSVTSSGNYHMSVLYRDLQLSMLAPGMGVDISSGSGQNQLLTEMVNLLRQRPFRVVMDRAGNLLSLEGIGKLIRSAELLPAEDTAAHRVIRNTLEEVYGPDAFRSLFNLFIAVYPAVQPIANWTSDVVYYFNTKPVDMTNRYVHARTTGEEIIIQGIGMLNAGRTFPETTGMGKVKSTVTGSQTYDLHMDRKTGWIRECLSRQRIVVETTIVESPHLPSGLKIPSYTETVFEVRGKQEQKTAVP